MLAIASGGLRPYSFYPCSSKLHCPTKRKKQNLPLRCEGNCHAKPHRTNKCIRWIELSVRTTAKATAKAYGRVTTSFIPAVQNSARDERAYRRRARRIFSRAEQSVEVDSGVSFLQIFGSEAGFIGNTFHHAGADLYRVMECPHIQPVFWMLQNHVRGPFLAKLLPANTKEGFLYQAGFGRWPLAHATANETDACFNSPSSSILAITRKASA